MPLYRHDRRFWTAIEGVICIWALLGRECNCRDEKRERMASMPCGSAVWNGNGAAAICAGRAALRNEFETQGVIRVATGLRGGIHTGR